LFLAATLLLAPAAGCGGLASDHISGEGQPELPDQESYGVALTEMKGEIKNWIFYADYVATYNKDKLSRASRVKVEVFDDYGTHFSTILADSGLIYEQTNNLTARGNVDMTTTDGTRLETEELRWDNKEGKILSELFVKITEEDNVITGVGLESDARLEHFEIKHQIQGRLYQEPEESPSDTVAAADSTLAKPETGP
jgi:LPS export ABC transporter protein LptC